MDERQPVIPSDEALALPGDTGAVYGNVAVINRKNGPRLVWSEDHSELRVNTSLFPNEDIASIATLRQVAGHLGLTQAIQRDASILMQTAQNHPEALEPVLRWQGLARLRETSPDVMQDQPAAFQNQTLSQEFQWALDRYVLTGKLPDQLSPAVASAIGSIPKPQGRSLVDYIASGRYLKFDGQNYAAYIKPIVDNLAAQDKQTGKSQKFEYRPSQTQDLGGDKEPIQEGDVATKVTPFYGGYYREQICRYDPKTQQIVKGTGAKQTWDADEAPEDEATWKTKRTYEGTIQPGQEVIIKLPYKGLPLVSTIQPANAFALMKDDLGIIYLDPRGSQHHIAGGKFSFDFVLAEVTGNKLNSPPTEEDIRPVGGKFDLDTQEFLDELSTQNWLGDEEIGREIARFVRKKLRYPNDEQEIGQIDKIYLETNPEELWMKISEVGVAHCYWANIFRDELCKRMGIASRIATGPYVNSKDPRFDFAVVEARGMDKHAWGEVYSRQNKIWTHKGMDATPSKSKDGSGQQEGEQEPSDGDFGEPQDEQPELSAEEVEKLYQQLWAQQEPQTKPPTPEEMAARQFKEEKGVAFRDWQQLERWINGVNQTTVPAEYSIRHRPSTMYQEWRELFELLYTRREIPQTQYKGPVRQSEGEVLDDPVTAYVDIKFHEDDPSGYQLPYVKQREKVEVSVFDDDFVLDISGSMQGLPGDEQRKMVLSSEYNIKNLNERLGHSRYKTRMTTPLSIRSRVATFGDWTQVVQQSSDEITEKGLVQLDTALKSHNQSSQGLRESLRQYRESLDLQTLQKIKGGGYAKVLTVVSDGGVSDQAGCIEEIKLLRASGIIVQGIGFGSGAQDIRVVCHDPADPEAAVVIDDVRQATLVRHRLLMKHLTKL